MSGPEFAWEQIPEAVMEAFSERLRLVEMLLDPHLGNADKRAERRRYCEQHRVGERTIRATCTAIASKDRAACCSTGRGPLRLASTILGCVPSSLRWSTSCPPGASPNCASCSPPTISWAARSNASQIAPSTASWPSRASPRRSATACSLKTRAAPTARSRHRTPWHWCRPTPATASGSTPPKAARKPTCSSGSTTSPAKSCSASTTSTRSCPP